MNEIDRRAFLKFLGVSGYALTSLSFFFSLVASEEYGGFREDGRLPRRRARHRSTPRSGWPSTSQGTGSGQWGLADRGLESGGGGDAWALLCGCKGATHSGLDPSLGAKI